MQTVTVIGAGLAGADCANYLATHGIPVRLIDIKPNAYTLAHSNPDFGELVCSNSLKSNDVFGNACGLLKEEMRKIGSLVIEAADATKVPAGNALAVDRDAFAAFITKRLRENPLISIASQEAESIPEHGICVIATGPLTTGKLAESIAELSHGGLHFYDASAPIVAAESIDPEHSFSGARYGKGGDDYLNCPMNKEEYTAFVRELVGAERTILHSFEKREIFEGCMPVEVMAARGEDTLRYGPFKPVGLRDKDGNRFYAVLQLRKENGDGSAYNLVGCQTNLKWGEQKRIFGMIPALKNAEFLRYGVMHRNTYIDSPKLLNADFSMRERPDVYFAGQITGVEGYVESAMSGLLAAVHIATKLAGKTPVIPNRHTVCGALSAHVSTPNADFSPMNANYGILLPLETPIRDKKERYRALSERALAEMDAYVAHLA